MRRQGIAVLVVLLMGGLFSLVMIDSVAKVDPVESAYQQDEISNSLVLCEWVIARPLGLYQSYCEVCVDHGMVIDECGPIYGDRLDLYNERVAPVIDSLMTEYHRRMEVW